MKAYLDLMQRILTTGERRDDRTGTGTIGLFGEQLKIDLQDGFPLLTTKRVPFKSVVAELLWFLRGDTSAASLRADGCTIWDEWATKEQCARFDREENDLGPIYGFAWRHFGGDYQTGGITFDPETGEISHDPKRRLAVQVLKGGVDRGFDQIAWLVDEIRKNPYSRRLVVSAWNPRDAAVVALPPCHTLFQCCVQAARATEPCDACTSPSSGRHTHEPRLPRLSLHLYMRSADYFLGVPFNVASYALLIHLLARSTGLQPGTLTVSFGDVHLYKNHLDQAAEQLSREPRPLPSLLIQGDHTEVPRSILDPGWRKEHVSIVGYDPHPAIKAAVSV
jgi:thymidylate synthase